MLREVGGQCRRGGFAPGCVLELGDVALQDAAGAISARAWLFSISSGGTTLPAPYSSSLPSNQSRNWRLVMAFSSSAGVWAPKRNCDFLFGGAVLFELRPARSCVLSRLVLKLHRLHVREPQADIDHLGRVLERVAPAVIREGVGDGHAGAIEVVGDQDHRPVAAQAVEQVAAGHHAHAFGGEDRAVEPLADPRLAPAAARSLLFR